MSIAFMLPPRACFTWDMASSAPADQSVATSVPWTLEMYFPIAAASLTV